MSALSAFNTQLTAFFEEMSETYPEEKDIKAAADALKVLKKMNPKLIHATFMETVHKEFREPILKRDEDYLVKRAHEILSAQYSEMAFAFWIFDKHWKTMTESNKKHVWDYCKVLIILAEKVPTTEK
jgi:hypothetical protein